MKNKILLYLLLIIPTCLISQIPTASLVAYYPFCGNANDFSGNGLNGTVNGATLSTDRFGNANSAYTFNGTNSYINLPPANFAALNVYSYSMWIRPTSSVNPAYITYCVGDANGFSCLSMNYNAPNIFAGSYNVGSNPIQSYVFSSGTVSLNNWIHVVVTRDFTALKLYVNSVLSGTSATNGQLSDYGTGTKRALFGARSNLSYFFPGQIDDARIYSSVLNQSDVNALYNEPAFQVGVNNGTICTGGSFVLSPIGANSYTFSSGTPVVSPSITSTYTIIGTNSVGCTSSTTAVVQVVTCTGLSEASNNAMEMSIYPNPNNGSFTLQFNPAGTGGNRLELKDLNGRIVKSYQITTGTTIYSIEGTLSTGCYILHLMDDNKLISAKKLIVTSAN